MTSPFRNCTWLHILLPNHPNLLLLAALLLSLGLTVGRLGLHELALLTSLVALIDGERFRVDGMSSAVSARHVIGLFPLDSKLRVSVVGQLTHPFQVGVLRAKRGVFWQLTYIANSGEVTGLRFLQSLIKPFDLDLH